MSYIKKIRRYYFTKGRKHVSPKTDRFLTWLFKNVVNRIRMYILIFQDGVLKPELKTLKKQEKIREDKLWKENIINLKLAYENKKKDYYQSDYYMRKILKPNSRVLDIGCGNGRLLQCLAEKGIKGVGLDISKVAVDYARKQRGIEAYVCDMNNLNNQMLERLSKEKWDYVISLWALNCFKEPEKLILKFKDSAKEQIHGVVNSGWWPFRLRLLFGKFPIQAYKKDAIFEKPLYDSREVYTYWTKMDFINWGRNLGFKTRLIAARKPYDKQATKSNTFLASFFASGLIFSMKPRKKP